MNWTLVMQSLLVAGAASALACVAGAASAIWMLGLNRRAATAARIAALVVFALPPFLVTNCWLHLLGYTGTWHFWFPWSIYSTGGAIWILALVTWPVTTLLLSSAWERIEQSHLEYHPALRGWNLLKHLLWPMGQGAFSQAAALTFVLTLNNFAIPALLQVKVYSAEVWVDFNTNFSFWNALSLSAPLILAPCALLWLLSRQAVSWPHLQASASSSIFRARLGQPLLGLLWISTIGLLFFSLFLPLAELLRSPATWSQTPVVLAAAQRAIVNSVGIAGTVALLCVLLAISASTWKRNWGVALWFLFLVPGIVLGIGVIKVFNRPPFIPFYQSLGIVVFAFVLRYLAVSWTTLRHSVQMADRDLADAARSCGAARWTLFRAVQWPQIAGQAAAAWYVTYLLALWDVETLVLIVPPGAETVSLKIFNLLHYGHTSQVNALCLVLLLAAIAPLLAYAAWKAVTPMRIGAAGLGFLLTAGCSPTPENHTRIESKLFSAVEVIGSRGTGPGQFNKPRSVALDRADNLYVADMTGRVQKFSPTGAFLASWQMPQTDKGKPKGMARDRNGNILVIEPHYSRVNHFSPDGKLVGQWGTNGLQPGRLFFPRALAVSSRGNIYLSEYGMIERIQSFSNLGENFIRSFGEAGTKPGQLNRAEGLGIDKDDRVYVADSCNHRIQIFNPDGQFLREHGKPGSAPGQLSYPYDVRVDSDGLQFVCEFGNSRVQIFDANDQPVEMVGGIGLEPGQLHNPWSIALDSKGNLFVADSANHRVQKFVRKRS